MQIGELYDMALGRAPEEFAAFLAEARADIGALQLADAGFEELGGLIFVHRIGP